MVLKALLRSVVICCWCLVDLFCLLNFVSDGSLTCFIVGRSSSVQWLVMAINV